MISRSLRRPLCALVSTTAALLPALPALGQQQTAPPAAQYGPAQTGPNQYGPNQYGPGQYPPNPSAPDARSIDPLQYLPPQMELLSRTSAFHTDLTFDRRMLALAGGLWEGGNDPAVTQAIDRLNGLAVHNYHYAAPGLYDPALIEGIRQAYAGLGWQHMIASSGASNRAPGSAYAVPPSAAPSYPASPNYRGSIDSTSPAYGPERGKTELWVRFEHLQVTGAVILFENPTNIALVAISGNLSPLDLLHLRGHFGIPRFDGDHFGPVAH